MIYQPSFMFVFFFFNDTATTEIYTLSLHDALPICAAAAWIPLAGDGHARVSPALAPSTLAAAPTSRSPRSLIRSEEHTSELQSRLHLVCRLLLEKKKTENECASNLHLFEVVYQNAY